MVWRSFGFRPRLDHDKKDPDLLSAWKARESFVGLDCFDEWKLRCPESAEKVSPTSGCHQRRPGHFLDQARPSAVKPQSFEFLPRFGQSKHPLRQSVWRLESSGRRLTVRSSYTSHLESGTQGQFWRRQTDRLVYLETCQLRPIDCIVTQICQLPWSACRGRLGIYRLQ